jgi:hypothetical protein
LAIAAARIAVVDGAPRPGRYKLGPLYLTPRFELKNAGVDTNVLYTQTDRVGDTSIIFGPALQTALPVGHRLRLTSESALDINYYRRRGSERSVDFSAQGRAELDIGPLTFSGGGGGGETRQRFTLEMNNRVRRQESWGTLGLRFRATARVSMALIASSRVHRFENDLVNGVNLREAFDCDSRVLTAEGRYALTRQTTFLTSAEVIADLFLAQRESAPRSNRSYRYLAGFELGQRAFMSGKVLVGRRVFAGSAGVPAYRGPALTIATQMPLMRFGRLTSTFDRDVRYALVSALTREDRLRNIFVHTTWREEAAIELPFDLMLRGTYGFESLRFLLPYPTGARQERRVDHARILGGSVLRRIARGVRLGVRLHWTERLSTLPGWSYDGWLYGLQAEITP